MSHLSLARPEKISFLDNFGSLLGAGIPIIRALQIIYFQSENKHIRSIALEFKTGIETGRSIATISENFPTIFSPFDRAMFEMGDATGKMGQVFEVLVVREERSLELERKVRQALVYPISIVSIAIVMIITIMTYVVPKIEKIYHDSHANLPALTQGVIDFSHFLHSSGVFLLGFLVLLGVGVYFLLRTPVARYRFDRALFSIPIFGRILQKKTLIMFVEFLSTLLGAGILVNRALTIVRSGSENTYYGREIDGIIQDVRAGKSLSAALGGEYIEAKIRGEENTVEMRAYADRVACFPIDLSTAVKIGEQTGMLTKMLDRISERYAKEVDATIKGLSGMLEPIIIVFIGGIVGMIIMAIMLPFFNMANVIG